MESSRADKEIIHIIWNSSGRLGQLGQALNQFFLSFLFILLDIFIFSFQN